MALTDDKPTAKKILCDNCDSEDTAQSRCNECGIFLCQFCTDSHKRYRSTKHHELLSMKELKSNPAPQTIAEKIRCHKHKEEVIKLFCKACQTTICRDCTIVDHRGHNYGFVEEVAVGEKQKIYRDLNRVKQRKTRLVEGIENLTKFNENLDAKKNSTISEINQHFYELTKATECRKQEMVERATSLTNSKQKEVRAQLEILETALASCESSIEFTEEAFQNGNDVQILSLQKCILKSLEQLNKVKDETEPCVTQEMMFSIPSSVQETKKTLLTKYNVRADLADPAYCKASFKADENCKASSQKVESDTDKPVGMPGRIRDGILSEKVKTRMLRREEIKNRRKTRKSSGREEENCKFAEEKCKFSMEKCEFSEEKCKFSEEDEDERKTKTKEDETVLDVGKMSFITLICNNRKDQRNTHGGQVIKPSFTGLRVSDVAVTDNDDGSYTISFCPVQGGMLKFEVSINEIPAPNCSLTKQVRWVISDVHGSGDISNGGLTMKGRDGQYCFRVGDCYFESGVHKWKVQIESYKNLCGNYYSNNYTSEIGVIDCDDINGDIANSKKKWVYRYSYTYRSRATEILSLTLDKENGTLDIQAESNSGVSNYRLCARRVSPFFACSSNLCISLVE